MLLSEHEHKVCNLRSALLSLTRYSKRRLAQWFNSDKVVFPEWCVGGCDCCSLCWFLSGSLAEDSLSLGVSEKKVLLAECFNMSSLLTCQKQKMHLGDVRKDDLYFYFVVVILVKTFLRSFFLLKKSSVLFELSSDSLSVRGLMSQDFSKISVRDDENVAKDCPRKRSYVCCLHFSAG